MTTIVKLPGMALPTSLLLPAALCWYALAKDKVQEPYLDEVFHVRQAQHYCAGHFDVWDPKITTPPGLYFLSYLAAPVFGCGIQALRGVAIVSLYLLWLCIHYVSQQRTPDRRQDYVRKHTAVNVCLFPPLFFFSALYYTDVPSTLSVALFYLYLLHSDREQVPLVPKLLTLQVLGAISLLFRQTNILWLAVFPAGLVLVRFVDQGHEAVKQSMHKHSAGFGDNFASVVKTSWKFGVVYEPSIRDAWIEDYSKTLLSLLACTARTLTSTEQLVPLVLELLPFLSLLVLFAGFVVANGGVVLGDKSNHIATIHLPQMLYLWPYFTFFSWPLVLPYILAFPATVVAKVVTFASMEPMLIFSRRQILPRPSVLAAWTLVASAVVSLNTIVHPFTLADNRHYNFYVFRLLMNPWWRKYAATPIYILTAWTTIQALGAGLLVAASGPQSNSKSHPPSAAASRRSLVPDAANSVTVSFVFVWLATTALQLVTAPLVEPRYCILSWLFWRVHIPLPQPNLGAGASHSAKSGTSTNSGKGTTSAKVPQSPQEPQTWDKLLLIETAWFLGVNGATAYLFLCRGFEWIQEPGKVQRFMW